jgi:CubicO group peptidase (beta-lactamase class C family)
MTLRILIAAITLQFITARADQVDDYVREEMSKRKIPAVVLKVVHAGHELKTAAYGFANLELSVPATTDSVFEIGSITKQFTASCILVLQQDGKLSVEDRIGKYLPDIPLAWTNVTIRHLLTHTSGIRSYTGLDGFALTKRLTQAQFMESISRQALEFQPGESWKYSNTGYNLLGYLTENVSGKSYWQFLRERILEPLNMNATTDRNPGILIANRVAGYEQTNHLHINRDYDLTDVFSAGAMVSTVGDLAKWNTALDSETVLTSMSKKAAWSPQLLNNGQATSYGFGWFVETVEGRRNVGHGGSTSGFNASVQRFPDDRLLVILLTNTDESVGTTLARKVGGFYFSPQK